MSDSVQVNMLFVGRALLLTLHADVMKTWIGPHAGSKQAFDGDIARCEAGRGVESRTAIEVATAAHEPHGFAHQFHYS
ncbi:MAG TPA: hypothetical protein VFB12_11235 [Ktedonobacteraceae bacterium]|nr:hypothetical protein [Ktedonobacteraceae bacterium]